MKCKILFIGLFLSLTLIMNSNAQIQPENPGLEDWEDAGTVFDEPVNWSSIKTSDDPGINQYAPVVWDQSTDAHSGNYSVKLFNVETFGIVAAGTITNGIVHADFNPDSGYVYTEANDPRWNTPCNDRPDSIVAWVKYFPEQSDVGRIRAIVHTGDAQIPDPAKTNWVGEAEINFTTEINNWTRLSGHFNYYNNDTPDYLLIVMYSGNGTTPVKDSWVLIDDVELIYNPQGIEEQFPGKIDIYSQNNSVFINWESKNSTKNADIKILDISGRTVWTGNIKTNEKKIIQMNVPKGIYVCQITGELQVYTQKLLIQ